jgi:hypothetical protein
MDKQMLIDFFDHNKNVDVGTIMFTIGDSFTNELINVVTNRNRVDMFVDLMLRKNVRGVFTMNNQEGKHDRNRICYSPLMPGCKLLELTDMEAFRLGFYKYHSIDTRLDLMRTAAKEYDKDDYYTMMCKIELLSYMVKCDIYYDEVCFYPNFFVAVQCIRYIRKHKVWKKHKHDGLIHHQCPKEVISRVRKYLDNKKASYPISCVGMNCVEKYRVLTMTIRRSFNNPPFILARCGENLSKIRKYLLYYCSRKTILKLCCSETVSAKIKSRNYSELFWWYKNKDYGCLLGAVVQYSNIYIIKKYLHKAEKRIKQGLSLNTNYLCIGINNTVEKGRIDIIKLIASTNVMQFVFATDIHGRYYVEKIKEFMRINDIDMV